jgi:RES domain-containing protein
MERILYRAVFHEYVADPLPSRSVAARFHQSKSTDVPTTYLAASAETAWREVTFHWKGNPNAYRIVRVECRLSKILDLTEPAVQAAYGVNGSILTGVDYVPCQALARRAREEGFEAIWTFSAADQPDGRQLVVFLDQLQRSSAITVVSVSTL